MGNRNILSQKIGNVHFNVALFYGQDEAYPGRCGIYSNVYSDGGFAEVRTYGNAADLRRLGEAFLAAADEAEKEVQA